MASGPHSARDLVPPGLNFPSRRKRRPNTQLERQYASLASAVGAQSLAPTCREELPKRVPVPAKRRTLTEGRSPGPPCDAPNPTQTSGGASQPDVPGTLPSEARFLWTRPLTDLGLSAVAATERHVAAAHKDAGATTDIFGRLDAETGPESGAFRTPLPRRSITATRLGPIPLFTRGWCACSALSATSTA